MKSIQLIKHGSTWKKQNVNKILTINICNEKQKLYLYETKNKKNMNVQIGDGIIYNGYINTEKMDTVESKQFAIVYGYDEQYVYIGFTNPIDNESQDLDPWNENVKLENVCRPRRIGVHKSRICSIY